MSAKASTRAIIVASVLPGAALTLYAEGSSAAIVQSANSIAAKHSGKCIDVFEASGAAGVRTNQWVCTGASNQQWTLKPYNDAFQIVVRHSGQCLNVEGASQTDRARVVQWPCGGADNELWYARPVGDHYQFVAKHSGKCLNVAEAYTTNGADLVQWPCVGADNELWSVPQLAHTTVQAKHSKMCLDVAEVSLAAGGRVHQWSCTGGNNQQWTLKPYKDAYQIFVKHSGQCLNVAGASAADGAGIIQWPCVGADNELWYPRALGDHYQLVAKHSGKCLNVAGAQSTNGAALIQWPCVGAENELWKIHTASTTGGKWSDPIPLPTVPVAAANLPNGKLLLWSSNDRFSFGGGGQTYTGLFDPATNRSSDRLVYETGHDMFCPGTSNLPDGRILVNGGVSSALTSIYDPINDSWTRAANMNVGRGYQGNTVLSSGDVFTVGGSWSGGVGNKIGEVWSPATGWRRTDNIFAAAIETDDKAGEYRSDNHAWLFAVNNREVFHAGPSKHMNRIGTDHAGFTTPAGDRAADSHGMNGNAVMYDIGKILTAGGAPDYEQSFAKTNAHVIDINAGVATAPVASLAYPRAYNSSVVLPTGEVIVFGGQGYAVPFSDLQPALVPELWDPANNAFTSLMPMRIPRTYHSVALLMADGRVFVGGGGLCGACDSNHLDAEIFTPPYLLNPDGTDAARPSITQAPGFAGYGATIRVTTDTAISKFALVRLSSVTHAVNNDQRRIPLSFAAAGTNTFDLAIPSNRGIAIPGYYMLFALNARNVPSVAKIIRIG